MEKHVCKLCHRRFPTGRSLGGHMRSHVVSTPRPAPLTSSSSDSTPSYALRTNPRKSLRFPSDSDSDPSKRRRHCLSDEAVALCLVQLSRSAFALHNEVPKYQCEACKKVFASYQALGGHRANHKRTRSCVVEEKEKHECSVCFRVFGSGQALGGHMRTHFAVSDESPPSTVASAVSDGFDRRLLDLNLPAPVEDGEVGSVDVGVFAA